MQRLWMTLAVATLTAGCVDLDFSSLTGLESWASCGSGGFMDSCGSSGSSDTPTTTRRIHGTVTKDGAPLVSAPVYGGTVWTETDSLGEYTVPVAVWSDVSFHDPTVATDEETRRVTVDASQLDTLDVDFTAFDYDISGSFHEDGQPASGRKVWIATPPFISGGFTKTDSTGAFRLEGRLIRSQCDSLRVVIAEASTITLGDCGAHTVGS